MTDREALLATIIDRPNDDVARLVYADYIEEQGDAERAELIRVQIELASNAALSAEERDELQAREDRLLQDRRTEWALKLSRGRQRFRRGFVEEIATSAESLLAYGDRLFHEMPVQDLRIVAADHLVSRIATQLPGLGHVRTLDLSNNSFGGMGRLDWFLTSAILTRLESLILRNNSIWDDSLRGLHGLPMPPRLRRLDLSGNPFGDTGIEAIAIHPEFRRLTHLIARCDELPFHDSIHALGASTLAASPVLRNLQWLDLEGHYIGDAGLAALAASPVLNTVEYLNVTRNEIGEIGESGIQALVNSQQLHALRQVYFQDNRITAIAAEMLTNWPKLAELEYFDVRYCDFAPGAEEMLRASEYWEKFRLSENE